MLLPSALSCDSSQGPPLTRLQAALFASPPASPPSLSAQHAIGNIFSTCRSLQSLLAAPTMPAMPAATPTTPPSTSYGSQLPTPPLAPALAPMKLRLRNRRTDSESAMGAVDAPAIRKRVIKRTAPPRGLNKRRRTMEDDMGRDDLVDSDDAESANEADAEHVEDLEAEEASFRPRTPKRARIAPEVLPLGLERSDYHTLHADDAFREGLDSSFSSFSSTTSGGTGIVRELDGVTWSTEEDRILVELVLEKLKLTKSDWQDCARSLGKDRGSVGRRWKSLMVNGDVGLKRSSRRGRIHGTWR